MKNQFAALALNLAGGNIVVSLCLITMQEIKWNDSDSISKINGSTVEALTWYPEYS